MNKSHILILGDNEIEFGGTKPQRNKIQKKKKNFFRLFLTGRDRPVSASSCRFSPPDPGPLACAPISN